MAAGLIQEAVNLPSVNPKYKFGLLRSRSDATIKRSVAFKNVRYQRMCSESSVCSGMCTFYFMLVSPCNKSQGQSQGHKGKAGCQSLHMYFEG